MLTTTSEATTALFLQSEMKVPQEFVFPEGRVVAYCCSCPEKGLPNDDSAAVIRTANGAIIMAVADGVGGGPMGYRASAIAVSVLADHLLSCDDPEDLRPLILDAIENANREILEVGGGSATTLSVVEIQGGAARAYQVGDSMSLITSQRGVMKWKSTSHSPIGYAVESGMMDEFEAMRHNERHLVSNLVGDREMYIEIGSTQSLAARDTVLLGSDGLFDNLHLEEVVQAGRVGAPLDRVSNLVRDTKERMASGQTREFGKSDDLSVLLYTK